MVRNNTLTLESQTTTVQVSNSEEAKAAISKAIDEHIAALSKRRLEPVGSVIADVQPSLISPEQIDITVRALVQKKTRTKTKGVKSSA